MDVLSKNLLIKGGWVMIPILLGFIFAIGLTIDLPPKGVPLIEGKSLAKIKQIMQEIMYEKETIYRRADSRDT